MRDPVIQAELDFDISGIRSNVINDVPEQFIDDSQVDSIFGDQLHGEALLADFDRFCKENGCG